MIDMHSQNEMIDIHCQNESTHRANAGVSGKKCMCTNICRDMREHFDLGGVQL